MRKLTQNFLVAFWMFVFYMTESDNKHNKFSVQSGTCSSNKTSKQLKVLSSEKCLVY